jgi:6-pyruvoyltetrahydropterin/6-carboxytetrahydropterin synthase
MKVTKEFSWDSAHRIPDENGKCENLHGHTYSMKVNIIGEVNNVENGMLVNFSDIKNMVEPLVNKMDHAVIISENDRALEKFLDDNELKKFVVSQSPTTEVLCEIFATNIKEEIKRTELEDKIDKIEITISETTSTSASLELNLV